MDSETGLLESPRIDRLSVESKQLIADMYGKSGNLDGVCRELGIVSRTVRIAMNTDPSFKALIDEARERICDKAEGHIVEHMSRANNVVDRLSWLRAWRPSRWNPQAQLNVQVDVKQTENLSLRAISFIDTTARPVLPTPPSPDGKAP